ncbi:hypothetical protein GCM10009616_40600 [Microlunatus lacustris]
MSSVAPVPDPAAAAVDRRNLFRGGAIVAGAVGATALGALAPVGAQAADGDALVLGNVNEATFGTFLRIGGNDGSGSAALRLSNAFGPALSLEGSSRNQEARLQPGELAGSPLGPLLGTTEGTTYLATGFDLDLLPLPVALRPERLLDTRTATGRSTIVGSSKTNAVNSQGQLTAGSWIDVAVWPADDPTAFEAVFVNLTATRAAGAGYLTAYPAASTRPNTSTLNFSPTASIANGAFVSTGRTAGAFAVRIYVSQIVAVVMDVTGATVRANDQTAPGVAEKVASTKVTSARKARQARLVRKPLGRRLGR